MRDQFKDQQTTSKAKDAAQKAAAQLIKLEKFLKGLDINLRASEQIKRTAVTHKVVEATSELPKREVTIVHKIALPNVSLNPESIGDIAKDLKDTLGKDPYAQGAKITRFLYNPETGRLYCWDAYKETHGQFWVETLKRDFKDFYKCIIGSADLDNKRWAVEKVGTEKEMVGISLRSEEIPSSLSKLFGQWKRYHGRDIENKYAQELMDKHKGLNILEDIFVTKSLTGAALEAFNKLHPRGAEGTRIGGRFVKKVEGMVGEAISNAM
jgi:hypothetical protein